jgi:hypothetical protein
VGHDHCEEEIDELLNILELMHVLPTDELPKSCVIKFDTQDPVT